MGPGPKWAVFPLYQQRKGFSNIEMGEGGESWGEGEVLWCVKGAVPHLRGAVMACCATPTLTSGEDGSTGEGVKVGGKEKCFGV